MRAVAEGRSEWTDEIIGHLDLCLECRACETACPSGVPYASLLESARTEIARVKRRPFRERVIYGIFRDRLFPFPMRLKIAFAPVKLFGGVIRKLSSVLPGDLRRMISLLPDMSESTKQYALPDVLPAVGQRRYRVALFTGCISSVLFAKTNWATAHVLAQNGCEVIIPKAQGCCGALHLHSGAPETTRQFATHNLGVFDPDDVDAIIINAAGCGSTLKEYGILFDERDETAPLARRFSEKTRDISEFLAEIDLVPMTRTINRTVAYHDACHLAHGQKVRMQPRNVLRQVPGLKVVDIRDSEVCCGSAGLYNILQPDMAEALLKQKIDAIEETGAEILATGNPGCLMQIAKGLKERGKEVKVVHPIEILAEAYGVL